MDSKPMLVSQFPGPVMVVTLSNDDINYSKFSRERVCVVEISSNGDEAILEERKDVNSPIMSSK